MTSTESQFLETEDLSEYQGKWIAILDRKIISVGDMMSEVYEKAASLSSRTPLFHRISMKGEADVFIPIPAKSIRQNKM